MASYINRIDMALEEPNIDWGKVRSRCLHQSTPQILLSEVYAYIPVTPREVGTVDSV